MCPKNSTVVQHVGDDAVLGPSSAIKTRPSIQASSSKYKPLVHEATVATSLMNSPIESGGIFDIFNFSGSGTHQTYGHMTTLSCE